MTHRGDERALLAVQRVRAARGDGDRERADERDEADREERGELPDQVAIEVVQRGANRRVPEAELETFDGLTRGRADSAVSRARLHQRWSPHGAALDHRGDPTLHDRCSIEEDSLHHRDARVADHAMEHQVLAEGRVDHRGVVDLGLRLHEVVGAGVDLGLGRLSRERVTHGRRGGGKPVEGLGSDRAFDAARLRLIQAVNVDASRAPRAPAHQHGDGDVLAIDAFLDRRACTLHRARHRNGGGQAGKRRSARAARRVVRRGDVAPGDLRDGTAALDDAHVRQRIARLRRFDVARPAVIPRCSSEGRAIPALRASRGAHPPALRRSVARPARTSRRGGAKARTPRGRARRARPGRAGRGRRRRRRAVW